MAVRERMLVVICALSLAVSAGAALPDSLWTALYIGGAKAGYCSLIRTVAGDTVETTLLTVMSVRRGPANASVQSSTAIRVWERVDGTPLRFSCQESGRGIARCTEGVFTDPRTLQISSTGRGSSDRTTLDWPADGLLFEGLRLIQQAGPPREGSVVRYTTLNYSQARLQTMSRHVGRTGAGLPAHRRDTLYEVRDTLRLADQIVPAVTLLDKDWREHRSTLWLGSVKLEMVACSRQQALAAGDGGDLIEAARVAAPPGLPRLTKASGCVYRLELPAGVELPQEGEQKLLDRSDTAVILGVEVLRLPRNLSYCSHPGRSDSSRYLLPGRFIESDDSLIQAMARRAVGNARTLQAALKRICRFVRGHVRVSMAVGYASAAEVAVGREGDCTEFALLTTALCRAAGIPARTAVGLLYVHGTQGFYYHAWTQVRAEGRWISIDPLGEGFNPGYIAMGYELEERGVPGLSSMIGRIRVLQARPRFQ